MCCNFERLTESGTRAERLPNEFGPNVSLLFRISWVAQIVGALGLGNKVVVYRPKALRLSTWHDELSGTLGFVEMMTIVFLGE
jgi:hypothetical protein